MTRESLMTGSFIFSVLAIAYLIQELYKSYRESKIEPIETYFDEEPTLNIQQETQQETLQEIQTQQETDLALKFKQSFGGR